jgi:rRNA maturation RNase YbeY
LASNERARRLSQQHLSLLFVGDEEIQVLNCEYRGKDKPTDVLSFSQVEGAGLVHPSLGDIVISLDTTRAQARRFGVTLDAELLRLLIHGILHLLGYDHEKVPAREAAAMRRLERRLLARFLPQFRGAAKACG